MTTDLLLYSTWYARAHVTCFKTHNQSPPGSETRTPVERDEYRRVCLGVYSQESRETLETLKRREKKEYRYLDAACRSEYRKHGILRVHCW